jgi:hypothetical protein
LFGAAFFWAPGIGRLLAAGPIGAAIVGALVVVAHGTPDEIVRAKQILPSRAHA